MTWLLALDGATDQLALALCDTEGAPPWCRELQGGPQASSTLLPALMALMAQAGVTSNQIGAIGFGQGPGAFTSLRAVCAVTQGLALGWNVPVLALDSLLLVADDAFSAAQAPAQHWQVLMDARMNELYCASYQRQGDDWLCTEPATLRKPQAWCDAEPQALAGNGAALVQHQAPWYAGRSRAEALARLVRRAWRQGQLLDCADAQPLYVRDKVALTTAERAAP
jgi:tRNA threonylcarbamoyladenosine biosynthesis protein TsaB